MRRESYWFWTYPSTSCNGGVGVKEHVAWEVSTLYSNVAETHSHPHVTWASRGSRLRSLIACCCKARSDGRLWTATRPRRHGSHDSIWAKRSLHVLDRHAPFCQDTPLAAEPCPWSCATGNLSWRLARGGFFCYWVLRILYCCWWGKINLIILSNHYVYPNLIYQICMLINLLNKVNVLFLS